MFRIITGILLIGLTACVSVRGGSAYSETGAICNTSGIEARYTYLSDQSKEWRGALGVGLPSGGGAVGIEVEKADVEQRALNIARRMNDYDAEIDAFYRNATNSCKLAARCMEMHGYNEGKCRSSLDRWDDSEEEYADLLRDLKEIDAQIENLKTVSRSKKKGKGYRVNRCDKGGRNCSAGNYDY